MVTETVLGTGVKLAILERPSARERFIEVFIILFLCHLRVSFPCTIIFVIYIYIYIYIYFTIRFSHTFSNHAYRSSIRVQDNAKIFVISCFFLVSCC